MTDYEYWSTQKVVESGKYPFTMGQIRHYLLNRHKNGLQGAIRKIGKRLVVRIDLFNAWIESQGMKGGQS